MKRLMCIDVGNSNVKYALFERGKIVQTWKHPSNTTAKDAAAILKAHPVPCALASVQPDAGALIKELSGKNMILELDGKKQPFIKEMPQEMGADRVADAAAAWLIYGRAQKAVISMSFGTASTLLAIDSQGVLRGGWIGPGIAAQLEVMHERCALLPSLKMDSQSRLLGWDTETHMRNGVFVAAIGSAREWLATAKAQLGQEAVSVATGGWSGSLQAEGKIFDHVDQYLTLKGLYKIADAKPMN